jgi:hypothetical protein
MAENRDLPPVGPALPLERAALFEHLVLHGNRGMPVKMGEQEYRDLMPEEVIIAMDDLAERIQNAPLDVFTAVIFHGWVRLYRCFCDRCMSGWTPAGTGESSAG